MIEIGRVSKVKDGKATVAFARHGMCDWCGICSVTKDGGAVELTLDNSLELNVDDYVKVEIFKRKLRVGSVLIYLLPLCLIALGAGLGVLASKAASAILAVLGLIVGLAFAVPVDVFVFRKRDGFKPKMLEACTENDYINNIHKPIK